MSEAPLVKICGLQRREDVLLACELGADFVGVILSDGFGRSVESEVATRLMQEIPVSRVAVLIDETVEDAITLAALVDADVIQLHGSESPEFVAELEGRWRGHVWKSVRARSIRDVDDIVSAHRARAHGFVVEGWKAGVAGGGGARIELDGTIVRSAVPEDRTFVLAGGLTPETVADATARFLPDVVDVSSGVESRAGRKDPELLSRFFDAVRQPSSSSEHPKS